MNTKKVSLKKNIVSFLSTAISKIGSAEEKYGAGIILLWRTWIWQKLDHNQITHGIHLLLSLADEHPGVPGPPEKLNSGFFPSSVLKIVHHLNDGVARTSAAGDYDAMVLYVEVLALFTYFQHGNKLASAVDIFRQNEAPPAVELLHQSRTRQLVYHSQHVKPFKPSEIKYLLSESIKLFPGKHDVLSGVYGARERVFGLNDRLKTLVVNPEFLNQKKLDWASGSSRYGRRASGEMSLLLPCTAPAPYSREPWPATGRSSNTDRCLR